MLIEFRVENHRSIRDEQVLTMEAGRVGDDSDPRPRTVKGHSEKLLPAAAIYGANASGKSNVLSALAFMRDAVLLSHRVWSPEDDVPHDPFAWGPRSRDSSLFEATVLIHGVRYQYGIVLSREVVCEEWLFAWPHGRKQTWYTRTNQEFAFGEGLRGENKTIEDVTRPNALYLSTAAQHNHDQLKPIYSWFRGLQSINVGRRQIANIDFRTRYAIARLFDEGNARRYQRVLPREESGSALLAAQFLELIKDVDAGIANVRVNWTDASDANVGAPQLQFHHQVLDVDAWLPLDDESRGTQTFINLSLPILRSLRDGGSTLVDELESSLHPALAQKIVEHFNNPATNPNNAQLIFTTHDTNLLGNTLSEPVLRRDQVWFTEKDNEGATVLYPLTDYQPRKAENLERGYLQGRYGAIPFLGDFNLLGK